MPTRLTGASEIVLREAVQTDAERIFSIKNSVFGDNYLLYTIYQARQSAEFLRSLISVQLFVIAEEGSETVGYYNALPRGGYLFLNYIAVAPGSSSKGIGTMLLHDCSAKAGQIGGGGVELDVFASNQRAVHWYLRNEFTIVNDLYLYRLCLRKMPRLKVAPVASFDEMQCALEEEQRQGFSKLICTYMEQHFLVGLIAGHTCKLLRRSAALSDHDSATAIAALFPNRSYLILSSPKPPAAALPVADCQRSIRMRKNLVCR
jgi:ribosomal protein S18 acetylase RimI-like enzyme